METRLQLESLRAEKMYLVKRKKERKRIEHFKRDEAIKTIALLSFLNNRKGDWG